MGDIDAHRVAMQGYIEEGGRLRGLAARAEELSEAQPASEKRKLLDFVVSECRGRCGELEFVFREPFGKWRTGSDTTRQLKPKLTGIRWLSFPYLRYAKVGFLLKRSAANANLVVPEVWEG